MVRSAQEWNAIKCVPVSAVDTAKKKPANTKLLPLVAADATSKLVPMDVKAGRRPSVIRYPGHRGENRRDKSLIMKESDIMGGRRVGGSQERRLTLSLHIANHIVRRSERTFLSFASYTHGYATLGLDRLARPSEPAPASQ